MLLTKDEVNLLQTCASYNDEKETFELPKFNLKEKRPSLPKLVLEKINSSSDKIDSIKAELKKTSIKYINTPLAESGNKDSFCLNNIIK
jgi:hypothetical protein